jgi:hypothetical protein
MVTTLQIAWNLVLASRSYITIVTVASTVARSQCASWRTVTTARVTAGSRGLTVITLIVGETFAAAVTLRDGSDCHAMAIAGVGAGNLRSAVRALIALIAIALAVAICVES